MNIFVYRGDDEEDVYCFKSVTREILGSGLLQCQVNLELKQFKTKNLTVSSDPPSKELFDSQLYP